MRLRAPIAAADDLLLAHLSLLFVPVGVGVITHLALVSRYGVQLLVVIVLSTWIGLAVTAPVLRRVLPRDGLRKAELQKAGLQKAWLREGTLQKEAEPADV